MSVRAVRYYEKPGLIIPSSRSSGGFRLYGEESLKRLQIIAFPNSRRGSWHNIRKHKKVF